MDIDNRIVAVCLAFIFIVMLTGLFVSLSKETTCAACGDRVKLRTTLLMDADGTQILLCRKCVSREVKRILGSRHRRQTNANHRPRP